MFSAYELTEEEKKKSFYTFSTWDGDCYTYTVCETKEEYEKEKARRDRIQKEYEEQMKAYLESIE